MAMAVYDSKMSADSVNSLFFRQMKRVTLKRMDSFDAQYSGRLLY